MVTPYIFPLQYIILLQLLQIFLDFVCIDEYFVRFGTGQGVFQARRQRMDKAEDTEEFFALLRRYKNSTLLYSKVESA